MSRHCPRSLYAWFALWLTLHCNVEYFVALTKATRTSSQIITSGLFANRYRKKKKNPNAVCSHEWKKATFRGKIRLKNCNKISNSNLLFVQWIRLKIVCANVMLTLTISIENKHTFPHFIVIWLDMCNFFTRHFSFFSIHSLRIASGSFITEFIAIIIAIMMHSTHE